MLERLSSPLLILWASKHNWSSHHSEHHCRIKLGQVKLANDIKKMPVTKRFQPDQHLFKFIKEFGHAHKHTLLIQMFANHLFQLDQIQHYTWFQFSQKSLEKIQTNHATIHVKCQNLTSLAINLHYTVYVSQKLWTSIHLWWGSLEISADSPLSALDWWLN
jgi:magnesium-transporting ATPase (P-type)